MLTLPFFEPAHRELAIAWQMITAMREQPEHAS